MGVVYLNRKCCWLVHRPQTEVSVYVSIPIIINLLLSYPFQKGTFWKSNSEIGLERNQDKEIL